MPLHITTNHAAKTTVLNKAADIASKLGGKDGSLVTKKLSSGLKVNLNTKAADTVNGVAACSSLNGKDGLTFTNAFDKFIDTSGFTVQIGGKTITPDEALNTHIWEILNQYNEGTDSWTQIKQPSNTLQKSVIALIAGEDGITKRTNIIIKSDGKVYKFPQTKTESLDKDRYIGISLLDSPTTGDVVYVAKEGIYEWADFVVSEGKAYYIGADSKLVSEDNIPTSGVIKIVAIGMPDNALLLTREDIESYEEKGTIPNVVAGTPTVITFKNERTDSYIPIVICTDVNGDPVAFSLSAMISTSLTVTPVADCTIRYKVE